MYAYKYISLIMFQLLRKNMPESEPQTFRTINKI